MSEMKNIPPETHGSYQSPKGSKPGMPRFCTALTFLAALLPTSARSEPAPASVQPDDAAEVALMLEHPADGLVVGAGACGLLVAGRVGPPALDLVLVLDTSVSTAKPSGADVDKDGRTGVGVVGPIGLTGGLRSSDPDDSILAVEVAAARQLVARLDMRRTRAALVSFSGGLADLGLDVEVPSTVTRVPLTHDRDALDAGLAALAEETPAGGTHMAAGVDRATVELLGLRDAHSQADPRRARAAVLFTDGYPTVPYGPDRPKDNVRAALAAADRARKARIPVTTIAIGPDALAEPVAAIEIASRTGGRFLPVRDLSALPALLAEVDLLRGIRVELRNATHGAPARAFELTPDGSFAGFVPLEPGDNRIEARARTEAGGEASRALHVTLKPGAPAPAVPAEYAFFGKGAFEACLRQSRQIDLTAEELRREELRRQLLLELEQERALALERGEQQRRELELEPAPPAP